MASYSRPAASTGLRGDDSASKLTRAMVCSWLSSRNTIHCVALRVPSQLSRDGTRVTAEESVGAEAHGFDYDLVVIGGGSGGLACSKEAAKLGKKVACLDFVKLTPKGTQWGLGGTCVNVGCIPKKLMHQAGLIGEWVKDAPHFGWKVQQDGHDWTKLVTSVGEYIGSLNWGYRVALREASVKYINARGQFTGPHTLSCTDKKGKVSLISSRRFVIAVGGRPRYPGVPGDKEHCITSDDIFWLPTPPGKTLLVGASYIALETAGFLTALGFPVTVMARSIFLRGFDQEIAEQIAGHMERHGTRMLRQAVPVKFEAAEGGKVKVVNLNADTGVEASEVFDTVVLATGRDAETKDLNLEAAGVLFNPSNGKIVGPNEQTNVDHIFAIGDVLDTRQELTPVAIQAGVLLARRLYAGGTKAMDYNLVPTTVFTPLEYGAVGMSEEAAVEAYGEGNVEVYHSHFRPLEWAMNHVEKDGVAEREDNACYAKLVCNKGDRERVVGLHILGPNAGEITQGYAVAIKLGATKDDFDGTVGIHPTISEEFTLMRITKASGESPLKFGC